MDMQHAKMLKDDLDKAITKLVQDFETHTGLQVTDVTHYSISQVGKRPCTREVKVTAELS